MKKKILLMVLISVISSVFISCSQKIVFTGEFGTIPAKPVAGEELTILFKPAGQQFTATDELFAEIYSFDNKLRQVDAVKMIFRDGGWSGTYTLPKSNGGHLIIFKAGEEIASNNSRGYRIPAYDKSGNESAESQAAYAMTLNGWGRNYIDLEPESDIIEKLCNNALAADSSLMKKYYSGFVNWKGEKGGAETAAMELKIANFIQSNFTSTEEEVTYLYAYFTQRNDSVQSAKYLQALSEKFPKSEFFEQRAFMDFRKASKAEEKLKIIADFASAFPGSKRLPDLNASMISEYRNQKKFEEALAFADKNSSEVSPYSVYTLGDRIFSSGGNPKLASETAELGIKISRAILADPAKVKYTELSLPEFIKNMNYYLGLNLFLKGKILNTQTGGANPLPVLEEAYTLTEGGETGLNELYTDLLLSSKKYKEATEITSKLISSGKSSDKIKANYKESILNTVGSEIAAEDGLAELEAAAAEKMKNQLIRKMVSKDSPDFSLQNLKGETVTLSALKGKVVVIDFWATWCNPCVSSFPGMQRAVDRFANDSEVAFLFINTWERVKDKEENARKFISEKKYSFNVLMDLDSKVITSYKVRGIPTKFILDKSGKTRFISVGYSGNNDELVEELSTMISLIKD